MLKLSNIYIYIKVISTICKNVIKYFVSVALLLSILFTLSIK